MVKILIGWTNEAYGSQEQSFSAETVPEKFSSINLRGGAGNFDGLYVVFNVVEIDANTARIVVWHRGPVDPSLPVHDVQVEIKT